MTTEAPPRQRLNEFFLEVKLTKTKHIVVEGRADQRFIRSWLDDLEDATSGLVVMAVEALDVPAVDVLSLGLTEGNRSRVIAVAARATMIGAQVRCVADRDCGHDVVEHSYETSLWTDYPAMESYVLERRALEKANLLSFGGVLPNIDELFEQLTYALRELFAVRRRHPHLPRPNYKAGLARRAPLDKFDVRLTVDLAIRGEVGGYERSTATDPRNFAYGHDIGELMLAAFGNELQNKAGLRSLAAIEGALRSAIQAAGSFRDEPLFRHLAEWVRQ